MSEGSLVLYDCADGVATITLNRPEKLNAMNRALYAELDAILARLAQDDTVKAVVLTGAGKAFTAGADLSAASADGLKGRWESYERTSARQFSLWDLNKPVIAAIHGYAIGRGLELALWCDIIIASEDAQIGQPEVRDGSFIANMLPWLLGMQRAKLFMMTGDILSGREAEAIGLVAKCVPAGQDVAAALKLARRLAHLPVPTARAVKRSVNAVYEAPFLSHAPISPAR